MFLKGLNLSDVNKVQIVTLEVVLILEVASAAGGAVTVRGGDVPSCPYR